ncbi:hypothetical protein V1264_000253 [Littorina saxatilis]|uniref:Uncharacterized protein n=1 Tax=Littorina saxatilis TaxID=31220 RepID=A0AAN9BYY9_9CAEN
MSRAMSKKRVEKPSRMPTMANKGGENLKEKQQRLREEREQKRMQLDKRHHYIIQMVAHCMGLEKNDVEEHLLEATAIQTMNNFLAANGEKKLMFYYQEPEVIEVDGNDCCSQYIKSECPASI